MAVRSVSPLPWLFYNVNGISPGGGSADPNLNSHLATVIKKAKDQNVPKDNIERAIERVRLSYSIALWVLLREQ